MSCLFEHCVLNSTRQKVYGVMLENGCAMFFCLLQSFLLDGIPHLQPEAMWDAYDLRKSFTCQASAYSLKHTLTNIRSLCLSRPVKPVCKNLLVKVINESLPHFHHLFPGKTTVSLCTHLKKKSCCPQFGSFKHYDKMIFFFL